MSKDKKIVLTLDAGGTNFVFSAICDNEEIVEPVRLKAVTTDTEGGRGIAKAIACTECTCVPLTGGHL